MLINPMISFRNIMLKLQAFIRSEYLTYFALTRSADGFDGIFKHYDV